MTEDELVRIYPRLWHMAEDGAWPSIRAQGLLSTSALLDRYGLSGPARDALEARRRPQGTRIARAGLPDAVVRDQKPMSDAALRRCLDDGLGPADWYRILNDKAFFWLSRRRLRHLLDARAYRGRPQTVLTLCTRSLVAAHRDRILLSPINSGAAFMRPVRRGRGTFMRIAAYPYAERRATRSRDDALVELTVAGGVPDVADHVLAVHRLADGAAAEIWRSPRAAPDDGP
ncbi:conserved hypothetical protein [Methylobacterium sp. 4-46]|uniref:DUF7002 family protein n=1 Tax=unclassified Methylobacterium TaxID=2615210 RepID=UPI000165CA51|nr:MULTISPECIES: hypothetical protein [Methylobacterium]ACA15807.1 conserved hypothetical protein [Methylobacterium sp. 4-46]WFT81535.1 hypothetical protein QA634_06535 [Methylobacterium nodulans]